MCTRLFPLAEDFMKLIILLSYIYFGLAPVCLADDVPQIPPRIYNGERAPVLFDFNCIGIMESTSNNSRRLNTVRATLRGLVREPTRFGAQVAFQANLTSVDVVTGRSGQPRSLIRMQTGELTYNWSTDLDYSSFLLNLDRRTDTSRGSLAFIDVRHLADEPPARGIRESVILGVHWNHLNSSMSIANELPPELFCEVTRRPRSSIR
jgi:hypothetical protein